MAAAGKLTFIILQATFSRLLECRAFAVVETIESAYAINKKQKLQFTLSSQQLISCDQSAVLELDGCKGGVLKTAFESLKNVAKL